MTKEPSLKKRLLLYPIFAAMFCVLAYFLVLLALGYEITYKNGKFESKKTGTIILNSKPGEASVFLDGKLYKKRTPSFSLFSLKINRLSEGEHEIRIEKDGYESYRGLFNVEAGLVSWANYVILVPTERKAENFSFPGNVIQNVASDDKTREAVVVRDEASRITSFWEVNLASKEKRRFFEHQSEDGSTYRIMAYSKSNERILFEKTVGEEKNYIVMETRTDGTSWDITNLFRIKMDRLVFNPRNQNELFVTIGTDLHSLDYSSGRLSAVVESGVTGIYPLEDGLYFVKAAESNTGLYRIEANGAKTNVVKALPSSPEYDVAFISDNDAHLILNKKDKDLYLYHTEKGKPTLKRIAEKVDYFTVSPKDKYVAYAQEGSFFTYDIEKEKAHETLKNREIKQIGWFYDDSNLYFVEGNTLKIVHFNGFYEVKIFDIESDLKVYSSPGSLNIFYPKKNDNNLLDIFSYSFNS